MMRKANGVKKHEKEKQEEFQSHMEDASIIKHTHHSTFEVDLTEIEPKDRFNLCYLAYFTLGTGVLFPWNAFITAVDYFQALYPGYHVDRIFSVCYMCPNLITLGILLFYNFGLGQNAKIYCGFTLYIITLAVVPLLDVYSGVNILPKGSKASFALTVFSVLLTGIGDGISQGSVFGSASHLPPKYTQALVSGTSVSGVIISFLRIFTKAICPQNEAGLRISTFLYFAVAEAFCILCIMVQRRLPTLEPRKHYDIKFQSKREGNRQSAEDSIYTDDTSLLKLEERPMKLSAIFVKVWPMAIALALIYAVTLSIFPGFLAEDVESRLLGDWYPIILITMFNIFDFLGKSSPIYSIFRMHRPMLIFGLTCTRLAFYGLYLLAIYGPVYIKGDVVGPLYVSIITCALGFSNGHLTSNCLMEAPCRVNVVSAEKTEMMMVWFLLFGLFVGALLSWLWLL